MKQEKVGGVLGARQLGNGDGALCMCAEAETRDPSEAATYSQKGVCGGGRALCRGCGRDGEYAAR